VDGITGKARNIAIHGGLADAAQGISTPAGDLQNIAVVMTDAESC